MAISENQKINISGTYVRNTGGVDKIVDGKEVEGGYFVCESLPSSGNHWTKGQLCYCTGTTESPINKFYQYNGSSWAEKTFGITSIATTTALGLVKSTTTGNTADRYYDVQVNDDGTMTVNVPWIDNTDTKNTAGATNSSSKLFLIGATSQDENPQTYSHDTAYVGTDGCLYSGGSKVLTSHQSIYNLTLKGAGTDVITFDPNSAANNLDIVAGSNVTVTGDATNKKITIAAKDTTYSSKTAASGGTDVSLVTTGEKYTWNNKLSNNISGHIYLTGANESSSTGSTSQLVFGTSSNNHVVLSSNNNALVINPTTSATTNQIVLYLDSPSQFPSGITSNGTIQATTLQEGGTNLSSKYAPIDHTHTITDTKNTAGASNKTSTKLFLVGATSQTDGIQTYSNSEIFINTSNEVEATGFYAKSDKRLKENIKEFIPTKSILELPVVEFDYINTGNHQIGCLAQDLQEICPEIVNTDENGYLSINESKLVYLLLLELKKVKEELNNRLNNLENKIL